MVQHFLYRFSMSDHEAEHQITRLAESTGQVLLAESTGQVQGQRDQRIWEDAAAFDYSSSQLVNWPVARETRPVS